MNLVRLTIGLILLAATTFSCRMEDNRSQSQIAHQTKEMINHYNEGNATNLSAYFLDSAYLSGPGGYRVQGKEVLADFWARHFIPLNWHAETQGYHRNLAEVKAQIPPEMKIPWEPIATPANEGSTTKHVFESATWTWTFQREEGIIQKEENQVIVCWTQTSNGSWKISELFMY